MGTEKSFFLRVVVPVAAAVAAIAGAVIGWIALHPPTPAGRAAYIEQVDALCGPAVRELSGYGQYPRDAAQAVEWTKSTNQVWKTLYQQWAAIPFPDRDEGKVRAILDELKLFLFHSTNAQHNLEMAISVNAGGSDAQPYLDTAQKERGEALENVFAMDNAIDAYGLQRCSGLIQLP